MMVQVTDRKQIIQTALSGKTCDSKGTGCVADIADEHRPELNGRLRKIHAAFPESAFCQPFPTSTEQYLDRFR